MNRKGFINIGLIILGLLIVGAAGYFAFGPKAQAPEPAQIIGQNSLSTSTLIDISSPIMNQAVSSPVSISGSAKAGWGIFEGQAGVAKLFDGNGNQLGLAILKVNGDWMQPEVQFTAVLEFTGQKTEEGKLVFRNENPSGDPIRDREYAVPVKFNPIQSQTRKINLFYYDKNKDADSSCSRDAVLPVERNIPVSMTPIQDAVNLLLKGSLSDKEKLAGFQTEFPLSGFSLIGANLKDGLLTLQFDDRENRSGGGSCRVGLLWAQIAKTALQFPEVKQVRFLPETLFQP